MFAGSPYRWAPVDVPDGPVHGSATGKPALAEHSYRLLCAGSDPQFAAHSMTSVRFKGFASRSKREWNVRSS